MVDVSKGAAERKKRFVSAPRGDFADPEAGIVQEVAGILESKLAQMPSERAIGQAAKLAPQMA